ncbi:hypothetical protein BC938DRAFT_475628 [Jimgerdemannia flammicorona]|uniref:Clathrin light chain n=1 Tax=Jimgerdemannia flammicorona TaxID=994334 RepID=A0A433PRG9_9FUNG|nr:hypothetical protein BC938DRAFT_475628 [Jimgerdemannia flammicorona]
MSSQKITFPSLEGSQRTCTCPNPADEFGGFDAVPSFEAVSNFNAAPSFDANASFTSGTSFDAGPILAQSTGQGSSPVPSAGSISQPASYTTPAANYSAFESKFPAAEDLETSQVFANVRSVIPEVEPEAIR